MIVKFAKIDDNTYFPINKRCVMIRDIQYLYDDDKYDFNSLLEKVKNYFEKHQENIVYLPHNRIFNFTKDEINAIELANELAYDTTGKQVLANLDIGLNPWDYDDLQGRTVGGYQNIINIVFNILSVKTPSTVIIKELEWGMHKNLVEPCMREFLFLEDQVKRLIFTTSWSDLLYKYKDYFTKEDFIDPFKYQERTLTEVKIVEVQ